MKSRGGKHPMENILEINNLSKTFIIDKRQNHILKNISFSVKKGEFLSIMGPSGSGKSTLLYNVSGMDKMTAGTVDFDGIKLEKLSENKLSEIRLSKMGFVFQQMNFLENIGILDNIIIPAYMLKKQKREVINKFAFTLMKKLGIIELSQNDISQVSGGQLQRAAICRALINKPEIIFADEPTGALNHSAANNVMDIFNLINGEGATIMLVTHDMKVALRSERVIYMIDGSIVSEIKLGKYDDENSAIKHREMQLSNWLGNLNF